MVSNMSFSSDSLLSDLYVYNDDHNRIRNNKIVINFTSTFENFPRALFNTFNTIADFCLIVSP